ncbi:hypothetical protein APSETT444_008986 [Aspergillus pseudonomiae]
MKADMAVLAVPVVTKEAVLAARAVIKEVAPAVLVVIRVVVPVVLAVTKVEVLAAQAAPAAGGKRIETTRTLLKYMEIT